MNQNYEIHGELRLTLPTFENLSGEEAIYGVAVQIRGDRKIAVHPDQYTTTTDDGRRVQFVEVRNNQYFMEYSSDILRFEVTPQWQECTFEVFAKKGSRRLDYQLIFLGEGRVELGEIRLVAGGFPGRYGVKCVPYLDEIANLHCEERYEQSPPRKEEAYEGLPAFAEDYLQVELSKLVEMIPQRRSLCARTYDWSPKDPDHLIDKTTGEILDPEKIYPVSGYEEVTCPSGKVLQYPYYLKPRKMTFEEFYLKNNMIPESDPELVERFFDPDYEKIYLDTTMVSTRVECFFEAAIALAKHFHATGDQKAGEYAAAIVSRLGLACLDWPVFGNPDWNYKAKGFFPPDCYENWFAFVCSGNGYWIFPIFGYVIPRFSNIYEDLKGFAGYGALSARLGYDTKKAIRDAVMHLIRSAMKYDAYYRCDLWKFYHNTMSSQIRGFVQAGITVGCPDIVHYAVEKVNSSCEYLFMNDGFFPESVSYLGDMLGILRSLRVMQGYSDPEGYVNPKTGKHFTNFDISTEISRGEELLALYRQMKFPDGTELALHDTWASTQRDFDITPTLFPEKDGHWSYAKTDIAPYLLPDFGHGVLAKGEGSHSVEAHLHYSVCSNHNHQDMLHLTLWGYGDELLSDLGYSHMGGYVVTTVAHNTVVVDKKIQGAKIGDPSGSLTDWILTDHLQFARAQADRQVYPQTEKYRRGVVMLPLEGDRQAIVDIFEVAGGTTHDYMLAGVADYTQTRETDLQTDEFRDNLADDGVRFANGLGSSGEFRSLPYDDTDATSAFYGVFTDAHIAHGYRPFTVTLRPAFPEGEDFPGAGPRAGQKGKTACLKLHFPENSIENGQIILCNAPRYRYYNELAHEQEAFAHFMDRSLQKIILRSEGEKLDNTFVTVLEPFEGEPLLQSVHCLQNDQAGIILQLTTPADSILFFFKKQEDSVPLTWGDYRTTARLTVFRNHSVTLCGKGEASQGEKIWRCDPANPAELLAVTEDTLLVGATLQESDAQGFCVVTQPGQTPRHLPIKALRPLQNGTTEIQVVGRVGFTYSLENEFLRETRFPHRTLYGKAQILLPGWAEFSIEE